MRDITGKPHSLRRAVASARVLMPEACMQRIESGTVDKGDPREAARIAAYFAAKRTSELLPHCHPLPLHDCSVEFEKHGPELEIRVEVATIGPTGVEMEALTAASVAALTIYDMLKPHAGTDLEIRAVRLLDKRGGKSDFRRRLADAVPATLISCIPQAKPDSPADYLADELAAAGFAPLHRERVPAEPAAQQAALEAALARGDGLVATVAVTGVNPGDCAVEAVGALIEQPLPGIMEAARAHGQARTPVALMSRGIAGRRDASLLITFPGSRAGAAQTWQAIAVGLIHAVSVIRRTRG